MKAQVVFGRLMECTNDLATVIDESRCKDGTSAVRFLLHMSYGMMLTGIVSGNRQQELGGAANLLRITEVIGTRIGAAKGLYFLLEKECGKLEALEAQLSDAKEGSRFIGREQVQHALRAWRTLPYLGGQVTELAPMYVSDPDDGSMVKVG